MTSHSEVVAIKTCYLFIYYVTCKQVLKMKMRTFWDVAPCSLVGVDQRFRGACIASIIRVIAVMIWTARISETSVYSNDTAWRYIPEGSHLHTRRRENLKSQIGPLMFAVWSYSIRPSTSTTTTTTASYKVTPNIVNLVMPYVNQNITKLSILMSNWNTALTY
jgi:hypothetical protein